MRMTSLLALGGMSGNPIGNTGGNTKNTMYRTCKKRMLQLDTLQIEEWMKMTSDDFFHTVLLVEFYS